MINFRSFFNYYKEKKYFESNIDIQRVMQSYDKHFAENSELINTNEVINMAIKITARDINNAILSQLVKMYGEGYSVFDPGPYDSVYEVYAKEIENNLIKTNRFTKSELEELRKTAKEKTELAGYPQSSFDEGKLGVAVGGITMNIKKREFVTLVNRSNQMDVLIVQFPHTYDMEDFFYLTSIIYHECRHLHDLYLFGIKKEPWYDVGSDLLAKDYNDYLTSYSEVKAHSAQIVHLLFMYCKRYKESIDDVVPKIKKYFRRKHKMTALLFGANDEYINLLEAFLDGAAKRSELVDLRLSFYDKEIKENYCGFNEYVVQSMKTLDKENSFDLMIDEILKLFDKIYYLIISPKKILKSIIEKNNIKTIKF